MALAVAYLKPNFVTFTKCEILVDHDPDTGEPTSLSYNKQTPLYLDARSIIAVSRKFDPYANTYLPVCTLIMKNAFNVDQSSFGLHVTDSYNTIKAAMFRDCDDLCNDAL